MRFFLRAPNKSPDWLQTRILASFFVAQVKKCPSVLGILNLHRVYSTYSKQYVCALFAPRASNLFALRVFASTRFLLGTLGLFFFSFILTGSALAEPQLTAALSRDKINTEETTALSIRVKWPKSEAKYQFAFPPFNLLENLTLVGQGESQETFAGDGGEWIEKTFKFELRGKKTGKAKIPAFDLSYVDPVEQKTGTLLIPAHTLTVTKKLNLKLLLIIAVLLSFFTGLTVSLVKIFARRKAAAEETLAVPSSANNLEKFKSFIDGNSFLTREFKSGMGVHLKLFLQDGYGITSSGQTIRTDEVIEQLQGKGLSRDEIYEIKTILKTWEEMNYAGQVSDANFREFRTQLLRLIQNKKGSSGHFEAEPRNLGLKRDFSLLRSSK